MFVSVDDFFDGNDDTGSIGCNIYPNPPTLKAFFDILSNIKSSPKTKDVLIRISDIEDTEWFYSDTVYLFGSYSLREVKALFKKLKPDEVIEGMMYDKASNISQDTISERSFSIWWD